MSLDDEVLMLKAHRERNRQGWERVLELVNSEDEIPAEELLQQICDVAEAMLNL